MLIVTVSETKQRYRISWLRHFRVIILHFKRMRFISICISFPLKSPVCLLISVAPFSSSIYTFLSFSYILKFIFKFLVVFSFSFLQGNSRAHVIVSFGEKMRRMLTGLPFRDLLSSFLSMSITLFLSKRFHFVYLFAFGKEITEGTDIYTAMI